MYKAQVQIQHMKDIHITLVSLQFIEDWRLKKKSPSAQMEGDKQICAVRV